MDNKFSVTYALNTKVDSNFFYLCTEYGMWTVTSLLPMH